MTGVTGVEPLLCIMRTRSNTLPQFSWNVEGYRPDGTQMASYPDSTVSGPRPGPNSYSRTIIDEPFKGYGEKPCKDTSLVRALGDTPSLVTLGYWSHPVTSPYYRTNLGHWLLLTWACDLTQWNVLNSFPYGDLPTLDTVSADVKYRAYTRLLPKVNEGFSLLNFLLELKDLRRMFSTSLNKYVVKTKGNRNIGLADDYLNYSFGWKPFISDVLSFIKLLNTLDRRLAYLEKHQGKRLRRNTRIKLDDMPEPPSPVELTRVMQGLYPSEGPEDTLSDRFAKVKASTRYVVEPVYHATMIYSFYLPKVGETRRKVRGWLDALGVRWDLSIVWNAIPFSFLIDWIVDVGGFLRSFAPNDLGMEIVIHDYSHSVKYHTLTEITGQLQYKSLVMTPSFGLVTEERRYYERARTIPSYSMSVGIPNAMQFSLAGALVVSGRQKSRYGGRSSRLR